METATILFITHKPKNCGVYEFGNTIFNAIAPSEKYSFRKAECESLAELTVAVKKFNPSAIIYNYHPSVMPWLCSKVGKGCYKNNIAGLKVTSIGIIHEVTQEIADTATGYRNKFIIGRPQKKLNSLFDYYIAADPTLLLKNPIVFKTGRLVPDFEEPVIDNTEPVIGSFGFATPKKGFENIVEKVQAEWDEATIRFNIPAADFGDPKGKMAKQIVDKCKSLIFKPGIKLTVSHNYLNNTELLRFLAANAINVFLYEDQAGRGLSSAIDLAMAVKKPIAVSKSPMFRHILDVQPSVCVSDLDLKTILANGFGPLYQHKEDWNRENMQWDFERIITRILSFGKIKSTPNTGLSKKPGNLIRKIFTLPAKQFTWLRSTSQATEDDRTVVPSDYTPVRLLAPVQFNRILDDTARQLYSPSIDKLFELAPKTMAKKIARANVQQGFIFDTVYRFIKDFSNPKILCVGSYEDTASMALQRMGYTVEEIDPMINYYLQEFYTKPSTVHGSYQIIFSTSVIEHDPDDESFMKCIEGLLVPGGIAVITCDYKDGWKPGQPKPDVDARFYTQYDLEKRLLSYVPKCSLIDAPDWNCPEPDFNYLGKYQYTFATFSIKKL